MTVRTLIGIIHPDLYDDQKIVFEIIIMILV